MSTQTTRTPVVLVCDEDYRKATGLEPECEDYCNLSLDHTGLCDVFPRAGGHTACQVCGQEEDRLHAIEDVVIAQLDEGAWWAYYGADMQGPYASAEAASAGHTFQPEPGDGELPGSFPVMGAPWAPGEVSTP